MALKILWIPDKIIILVKQMYENTITFKNNSRRKSKWNGWGTVGSQAGLSLVTILVPSGVDQVMRNIAWR